ncbi:MAG: hypothetical protein Q7T85_02625, partial [Nitrosomonas sp.]|nr:hypothetical protein [Nitrosomonas sp.]
NKTELIDAVLLSEHAQETSRKKMMTKLWRNHQSISRKWAEPGASGCCATILGNASARSFWGFIVGYSKVARHRRALGWIELDLIHW